LADESSNRRVAVRIGIISDLHGNVAGLASAIERMGPVDELLCAGDMVEESRFDNGVIELLRDRGARCVLGNHDLNFLAGYRSRGGRATGADPELVAWLAEQPIRLELEVAGRLLLMTHASPCWPGTQYVYPHSPEVQRLAEVAADFVVLGHTHTQMARQVGEVLVVNPGSAGLAQDPGNGRRLSYAVLDASDGSVSFEDYVVGRSAP
jgi:putative phosphoesterase